MLKRGDAYPLGSDALQEYRDFAGEVARAAGASTLAYFRSVDTRVDNKQAKSGGYDPVTLADQEAESIIRARIRKAYPDHGILGEEHGYQSGNGLTWVIDPIDGTRSFIAGLLHWGVLVALYDGERARVGAVYQPFTDELFLGDGSEATWRRGDQARDLAARSCGALSDALMCTTDPAMFKSREELDAFRRVRAVTRLQRLGGDCYNYCMLAMGQADLVVEACINPYDIQAVIPIIEGAGGVITTWSGKEASLGGQIVASGDPALHALVVKILSPAADDGAEH
ncbi:MAG: histidinol-phosphatase [Gammaproteobacteria bacterium]|jgi:histidinol phosphatase-like enzyme (inositol monophosphatase family)